MATHDHHELTCEPTSTTLLQCSSIALLQERFRQLQRVKKMREEKELLRMMPEPDFSNSNSSLTSLLDRSTPKWSFSHPDLIHLQPRSSFKFQPPDRSEFKNYDTQLSIGLRGSDHKTSGFVQNSGSREMDVDTSLHL
ncbi:hypothetical protein IHE45_13G036600 [Dioscorea alata]|uniref:Uncharacterized protein n=1 Tax=Dioscorea alata TaxID=55571 RepID=A0ACB7UX89_DIOAL|nr:hypothetical protein IHE45_13G036600 [Dioscorea alata]